MKNFLLLCISAVLFCLGAILSVRGYLFLITDTQGFIRSCPLPLPFLIFCGGILSLLVFAQQIYPVYSLYKMKLEWQAKYNYLPKNKFKKKISNLIMIKNVVFLVFWLTSWLIFPLLFYFMAFAFASIFVACQIPNENSN